MIDLEKGELKTAPFDPRFPNQNQTRHCYTSFLDYHRCIRKRGEDYPACQYYLNTYKCYCPTNWSDKWTDQIENGTFAGDIGQFAKK